MLSPAELDVRRSAEAFRADPKLNGVRAPSEECLSRAIFAARSS